MNKSWKSFENGNLSDFLEAIEKEWNNQDKKFPNQKHTIEKWIVIIMEEIGEISKEVLELNETWNITNLYEEIIQTITLLIRLRYSLYHIDTTNKNIII